VDLLRALRTSCYEPSNVLCNLRKRGGCTQCHFLNTSDAENVDEDAGP